ncbi:hypothetical protein [Bosea sp. (in: a-proteobacteria)]|uniref:hypothetical protein n=1 Tax=Bosea sp. (in: a-proteobacteria) TaxID=1871050 RepID=UPI0027362E99|nr:hypothetical protein [Bosea sp. (in: a-proteobacteria)]MDP3409032.1 hypothetical protein [Bosea sp. (in: a-proteobacteria)]
MQLVIPDFLISADAWNAGLTGDWAKDNAIGRQRADALQANIRMTGNYPLLSHAITLLRERPRDGIEIGFLQRLSEMIAPTHLIIG